LDGKTTIDKIMIVIAIFIGICLFPVALYKGIKQKAQNLTDYFSKNRVIFNTKEMPTKIKDVTVQCKNCHHWGESGNCGVMPSEKMDGESWCMTSSPTQFFIPKENK
jgi:hypothetical protein